MADSTEPEIIFSDLTQDVVTDGHRFTAEIYRTSDDPSWILPVENMCGTLTVSDNAPYLADGLAWHAFEQLVEDEGSRAFYSAGEGRELRL